MLFNGMDSAGLVSSTFEITNVESMQDKKVHI